MNKEEILKVVKKLIDEVDIDEVDGIRVQQVPARETGDTLDISIIYKQEIEEETFGYYQ